MAGSYTVDCDGIELICTARKKVKNIINIFVGDYVEVADGIIESVYPRKNCLTRPYVANIDVLIIVVAKTPEPDWILIEKLILNCRTQSVEPIILINKSDLMTDDEVNEWSKPFENDVHVWAASALTGKGTIELKEQIFGKLVCLAGQSAVGKTSLLNALLGGKEEVGELSAKIQRGKNTTRRVEIYDSGPIKIVDTCGFSILEETEVKYDELSFYYEEYVKLAKDCRFPACTHTAEPDCAVKRAVNSGNLNAQRYSRYLKLFEELKENWRNKYV